MEITTSEYAATLPYSWYSDPDLYDHELASVFKSSWQLIGVGDDLRDPGSTLTASIAGVPILVARDDDGVVRGFVNVCRHRGHVLATKPGTYARFRCPYHGWTYGLDGRLIEAPGSPRQECLKPPETNLQGVRVEEWGPLLFANLSGVGPTLAEHLGDVSAVVADAGLGLSTLRWHTKQEWLIEANWKFYTESNLELCQYPTADGAPTADREALGKGYEIEIRGRTVLLATGSRADHGGRVFFPYVWPNLQLHVSASALVVSSWRPVSPVRTCAELDYFFSEGTPTDYRSATIERYDEILGANIAAVESVQRGAGSNQLEHGLLSTESERGIRHFHELVRSALPPSPAVDDAATSNGAQA